MYQSLTWSLSIDKKKTRHKNKKYKKELSKSHFSATPKGSSSSQSKPNFFEQSVQYLCGSSHLLMTNLGVRPAAFFKERLMITSDKVTGAPCCGQSLPRPQTPPPRLASFPSVTPLYFHKQILLKQSIQVCCNFSGSLLWKLIGDTDLMQSEFGETCKTRHGFASSPHHLHVFKLCIAQIGPTCRKQLK